METSASLLTSTSFSANWNASVGVTGYYLDVATDNGFTSFVATFNNKDVSNVTTYSVSGLSGGNTYYYRVKAYNGSGASVNSGTITTITLPSSPVATAASAFAETSFSANWNSVTGATGYRLDISTDSGFGAGSFVTNFNDKDVSGVTTYSITGLTGGTSYFYRVRAYNVNGTSANSNSITALTIPIVPTATAATLVVETSFSANWNSVTGATKYYLDVSTSSGFGVGTFVAGYQDLDVSNVTTYSITSLTANTNYYYRVRAYNPSGTSGSSNTITILTAPLAPVASASTSSAETSFNANWNSSAGASGYILDVSTDVGFGAGTFETDYENKDVGNVTTFSVTGITSGTTHYFRVRAYNGIGISSSSGSIKVLGVPHANGATAVAITSFTANWDAVPGVTGYRLDVSTDIGFGAGSIVAGYQNKDVGNVTVYSVSGLIPDHGYYFRVRSYDLIENSGNSNVIIVKNVPPVLSDLEGNMMQYVEGEGLGKITDNITVLDFDNANLENAVVQISNNYKNNEDKLIFTNANGISGNWNSLTGTLTLSGSSALANYENALRSVSYSNSSNNPDVSVRTITFYVNDGINNSNSLSRDVSIRSVNTPPQISGIETNSILYKIKQSSYAVTDSILVTDVDNNYGESAVVSISGNYKLGEDSLIYKGGGDIKGVWDAGTGSLILNGHSSIGNYAWALRNVFYINNSIIPNAVQRTISITYDDGIDKSNILFRSIDIAAGNIPPEISQIEQSQLKYTQTSLPMTVSDSLVISDSDDMYLQSIEVRIEDGFISGEDVLVYDCPFSIKGLYNWGTGVLSLSGKAAVKTYENILRSVKYKNVKGMGSTQSTKKIIFSAMDGVEKSNSAARLIFVEGNITDVREINNGIPKTFALFQNYPNPFNPTSVIRFAVPKQSRVLIIIYDPLGREIEKLVDEEKSPGYYEVTFKAESVRGGLTSGLYIYTLRAGDYSQSKKMLLIK